MVLSIAKKAQALAAVATALDGLKPEDALEVLTLFPTMTSEKLGALASLAKDLGDASPEDRAAVVAMAEESIAAMLPQPEPRAPRIRTPPKSASPGRPMTESSAARRAFVDARGSVTLTEFAEHFGIDKEKACHWLKSAVVRRRWIAKGEREEYISLAEAERRRRAAAPVAETEAA